MKRFKLSPEAAQDIREIWAYIAADSIKAARRLRLQIFDVCQRIAVVVSFGVVSISKHQSFPRKRESSL